MADHITLKQLFHLHRDSFCSTIKKITKGKQIAPLYYEGHLALYAELSEAQAMVNATGNNTEFNRRNIICDIVVARLEHYATKFWTKDEKRIRKTGKPFTFKDLLKELQKWMVILTNRSINEKRHDNSNNNNRLLYPMRIGPRNNRMPPTGQYLRRRAHKKAWRERMLLSLLCARPQSKQLHATANMRCVSKAAQHPSPQIESNPKTVPQLSNPSHSASHGHCSNKPKYSISIQCSTHSCTHSATTWPISPTISPTPSGI